MSPASAIVHVVDDDDSVRRGLGSLVQSLGYAVALFADASAYLDAPPPDRPCCLLLDLQLPGLSGLELQQRLNDEERAIPIVFLTGRGDIPSSVRAMKAGAIEFLTKPFNAALLANAIRTAIAHDTSNRLERGELRELRLRYEGLSPREREVMARVVEGLLSKQIAAEFGTSEATVKEQRGNVMRKMKASALAELVRISVRLGL